MLYQSSVAESNAIISDQFQIILIFDNSSQAVMEQIEISHQQNASFSHNCGLLLPMGDVASLIENCTAIIAEKGFGEVQVVP